MADHPSIGFVKTGHPRDLIENHMVQQRSVEVPVTVQKRCFHAPTLVCPSDAIFAADDTTLLLMVYFAPNRVIHSGLTRATVSRRIPLSCPTSCVIQWPRGRLYCACVDGVGARIAAVSQGKVSAPTPWSGGQEISSLWAPPLVRTARQTSVHPRIVELRQRSWNYIDVGLKRPRKALHKPDPSFIHASSSKQVKGFHRSHRGMQLNLSPANNSSLYTALSGVSTRVEKMP